MNASEKKSEETRGFPRLCAHRGVNFEAPENTLPAFERALEGGADELELDLWPSKDGKLIVCHDPGVDRTSDGHGLICNLTAKEIRCLDAGAWFSPSFRGTRFPLFEEVLDLAAGKTVLNIHIKSPLTNAPISAGMERRNAEWADCYDNHRLVMPPLPDGTEEVLPEVENRAWTPYPEKDLQKILDALDAYHNRPYAYLTGEKDVLTTAREMAPDMPRCCLEGDMNYSIVEHAVAFGCQKAQFCKGFISGGMIRRAKANGLICNLFWADDPAEAKAYLDLGIDCILTNNLNTVRDGLRAAGAY